MEETKNLTYNDTFVGKVFVRAVETIVLLVFLYAYFFGVGNTQPFGIFDRVYFLQYDIHRFSILCIATSFLAHWYFFNMLHPLKRFVSTLAVITWYTYLGGVVWTTFSVIYRHNGFWILPYVGFVFTSFLLALLNKKDKFITLHPDKNEIIFFSLMCVSYIAAYINMSAQGFWIAMDLSDAGLGADPNMNMMWVFIRILSYTILLPLVNVEQCQTSYEIRGDIF